MATAWPSKKNHPSLAAGLERGQRLGAFGVGVLLSLRLRRPVYHGPTLIPGCGNSGVVRLPFGCMGGVLGGHVLIDLEPPLR